MWRDCKLNNCKLLYCVISDSLSCVPCAQETNIGIEWPSIDYEIERVGGYERISSYLWPHRECVNLVKRCLSYRHEDVNNASHVGNQGSMGIISSELTPVQSPTWLCLKPRIIDILQDLPRALCYEVISWSSRRSIQKQSASDSRAKGRKKEVNEDTEKDRGDKP